MKQDRSFSVIKLCLPLTDFRRGAELLLASVGYMIDQLTAISDESAGISVTLSIRSGAGADVAAARRLMQGRAGKWPTS